MPSTKPTGDEADVRSPRGAAFGSTMATRRRKCVPAVVIALLGALLSPSLAAQKPGESTPPFPEGWFVYSRNNLENPEASATRCFGYSRNAWLVVSEAGVIKVLRQDRSYNRNPALPPQLKREGG